jgi:hypothetical protein
MFFSSIDIDEYSKDLSLYRNIIYRYNLPIFPMTSKSGGLHLYLFWKEETKISKAMPLLQELLAILGLKEDTEIFPKQLTIKDGDVGSWINIPYYNGGERQYLLDRRGLPVPLAEALPLFEAGRTTVEDLRAKLDELPCSDGPPCMQCLLLRGEFDSRNDFFLSYGVYAKAKYEDGYAQAIVSANSGLSNPLPEKELQNTVIKSLEKQTYAYKCKAAPLVDACRRELCSKRTHGINAFGIPDLDYGEFRQVLTKPPYYEWEVNNIPMRFESENELIMQHKFRALCIRYLHKAPKKLPDMRWVKILNQAMSSVIVVTPDNDELSEGAILLHHIKHFLCGRAHGSTISCVEVEQVYLDTAQEHFVFRSPDLTQYLKDQKVSFTPNELRALLKEKGAEFTREMVAGKQTRLVRVAFKAFDYEPAIHEEDEHVIEADFSDITKEEWE